MRLRSYRERLLDRILESIKNSSGQTQLAQIAELASIVNNKGEPESLEKFFKKLSEEDRKAIRAMREEYRIILKDERDTWKSINSDDLWEQIAHEIGLLDLKSLGTNTESRLREYFNYFDTDQSGHISLNELRNFIHRLNLRFSEAQIQEMLKNADTSGDCVIDYEEFCSIFQKIKQRRTVYLHSVDGQVF